MKTLIQYHDTPSIDFSSTMGQWTQAKILLVDDEPRILRQLEQDLSFANFSLFKANSAEAGLEILKKETIHLIICDQNMPQGMKGTEFLYRARHMNPKMIGIILSAFGEPEHLFDAINRAKAFSYLLKPWDKLDLVLRLKEALDNYFLNNSLYSSDLSEEIQSLQSEKQQAQQELSHSKRLLEHAVQKFYHTQEELEARSKEVNLLLEITGRLSGMLKNSNVRN